MISDQDSRELESYGEQVSEIGQAIAHSAQQMRKYGDWRREITLSGNLLARLEAIHELAGGLLGRIG